MSKSKMRYQVLRFRGKLGPRPEYFGLSCFDIPSIQNSVDSFIDNGEDTMYKFITPGEEGEDEEVEVAYNFGNKRQRGSERFSSSFDDSPTGPEIPKIPKMLPGSPSRRLMFPTSTIPIFSPEKQMVSAMEDDTEEIELDTEEIGTLTDLFGKCMANNTHTTLVKHGYSNPSVNRIKFVPLHTRKIHSSPSFGSRSPPNKKFRLMNFIPNTDAFATSSRWDFSTLPPVREEFPDWTKEFHQILGRPLIERNRELRKLIDHFVSTAKRYGKLIIKERTLPYDRKSVKPLQNKGIAGGEKYNVANIFFKFAVDHNNLYPNDQCAMKVAGHELKGLTAVVSCGMIMGLSFPLLALIDYRGFRLVATSVLPISEDTIVYGSCDGGVVVHDDLEEMNTLMKKIAKILNLKGHLTGIGPIQKFIYGPCDIEGHQAEDGKQYVVDTSRIWPCEKPDENVKGSFMFRLFRGEFVSKYRKPLSSDAFSLFGKHNSNIHNHEIELATEYLYEKVIPTFAESLDAGKGSECRNGMTLIDSIHRAGINIRHLGRIRSCVKSPEIRKAILHEIIARGLKNDIRSEMRKITSDDNKDFETLILKFFNLIFGNKKNSLYFWLSHVKLAANNNFRSSLTLQERQRTVDLRKDIDMYTLFKRLQELTGILFRPQANPKKSLKPQDFIRMEVKEKHMYAVPRIEGDTLAEIARTREEEDKEKLDLYMLSRDHYRSVLELKADDYCVIQNLGTVTADIARLKFTVEGDIEGSGRLYKEAFDCFRCSLTSNAGDYKALNRWGNALCEQASVWILLAEKEQHGEPYWLEALKCYQEAGAKYKRADCIHPNEPSILYNWGNLLRNSAKLHIKCKANGEAFICLGEAIKKYKACTLVREDDTILTLDSLINWGCALVELAELQNEHEYLTRAKRQFMKAHSLVKWSGVAKGEKEQKDMLNIINSNLAYIGTLRGKSKCESSILKRSSVRYNFHVNDKRMHT